jgi:hypothetical protein
MYRSLIVWFRSFVFSLPLAFATFAFGLFGYPVSVEATTVVEQTFPDLVHGAEVIAVGTVINIHEQWDAARQAPFTLVTFSDLTVLKGDPASNSLTLHLLGGRTPDGAILSIEGMPRFSVGEKTVVFGAGNRRDFCPLVGVWQGVLRVTRDPQLGIETVNDNFSIPILGIQDGKFQKGIPAAPRQTALPLSTLQELIRQTMRGAHGQP